MLQLQPPPVRSSSHSAGACSASECVPPCVGQLKVTAYLMQSFAADLRLCTHSKSICAAMLHGACWAWPAHLLALLWCGFNSHVLLSRLTHQSLFLGIAGALQACRAGPLYVQRTVFLCLPPAFLQHLLQLPLRPDPAHGQHAAVLCRCSRGLLRWSQQTCRRLSRGCACPCHTQVRPHICTA